MPDSKEKLSYVTLVLHWLIASIIFLLLVVEMDYPILHKSLGLLIILPVIVRIYWRSKNGYLPKANALNKKDSHKVIKFERWLAKVSHWLLIIGSLLLPLSGVLISICGGYGLSLFGLELLAPNQDVTTESLIIPLNQDISILAQDIHSIVSNIMMMILVLHIAGALKHHFIDKDKTL
jgi:cytochrome b561